MIVAPGQKHAIALRPEFIVPQDGHDKQDCEINAAKRWIDKEAGRYLQALNRNVTFLGDDIYAHQPFCRHVLLHGGHFIFTCKPASHKHLTQWIGLLEEGPDLHTVTTRAKDAKGRTVNRCEGLASVGSAAMDNEECWIYQAMLRAMGLTYIEHQARI